MEVLYDTYDNSRTCRNQHGGICRGEAGELLPSLDLTFPPAGLSENLGGMERGGEGKGKGKGGGDHLPYFPLIGFCLKYHPASEDANAVADL